MNMAEDPITIFHKLKRGTVKNDVQICSLTSAEVSNGDTNWQT